MPLSVLLTDTELLYCAGAAAALEAQPDLALGRVLRDQRALEELLAESAGPHLAAPPWPVALIAFHLVSDLDTLQEIAAAAGCGLVLLLSQSDRPHAETVSRVQGTLRRSADAQHLCDCVRSVAAGRRWDMLAMGQPSRPPTPGERVLAQLSPRQIQVIAGVARGAKNADIAGGIGTTEQVVKNMLREIYDLAGVSDRLELALFVLHQKELAVAADLATRAPDQTPSG